MKFVFTAPFIAIGLLAGCASSPAVPPGMKTGQFVDFACDGGKRFQARLAADGSTVRIRHEGGYELDSKGGGIYEGAGWKLVTQGPGSTELLHNGKSAMKDCKSA
jgi:hypothetical protein